MSENRVLDQIEAAAAHAGFCVLPRNPKKLACSVWDMPDPAYHKGVLWRTNTGAIRVEKRFIRFGLPGVPDFTGWLFSNGRRIDIEAKTDNGKLSPAQKAYSGLCLKTGVMWGMARSYGEAAALFDLWQDMEKK